jgi:probable rRNA maturation factor
MGVATTEGPAVSVRGAAKWRVPRSAVESAVRAALQSAAPTVRGEVTVLLTGDAQIRRLNRRFRGKDRATDVLSFDIGDGRVAGEPFGDIVVSVETARRQAREYGAPIHEELRRLVVHGALHLCGLDHQERREAAKMHGLTRRLVAKLESEGRAKARLPLPRNRRASD